MGGRRGPRRAGENTMPHNSEAVLQFPESSDVVQFTQRRDRSAPDKIAQAPVSQTMADRVLPFNDAVIDASARLEPSLRLALSSPTGSQENTKNGERAKREEQSNRN